MIRKILAAAALALLAFPSSAQTGTSTIRWAAVPIDARSETMLTRDTQAQCDAAVRALNRTRIYTCERRVDVVAVIVTPPTCTAPRPGTETRSQACPTGTTGSWTQTRGYTATTYPTCWAADAWTPAAAPAGACTPVTPPASGLTYVDPALVPAARGGQPERRIRNDGSTPYRDPDGMGAFRTVCQWSHFNFDDPLVVPGQRGASHLHVFFGNSLTDFASTPDSIATTGNGSCRGGIVNRTAYWVPALIAPDGTPIRPAADADFYYKTGYDLFGQNDQVVPIPPRFRMIAGDSKSRVAQSRAYFECDGQRQAALTSCGGELQQVVEFPQCWDGVNLDSPDHKSHVVYASGGRCPATHPVHLPMVSYHIKYRGLPAGVRLSSDINGAPAGSSAHGDWMNGWEQDVLNSGIVNIVRRGLSGGSHMVGDGRALY